MPKHTYDFDQLNCFKSLLHNIVPSPVKLDNPLRFRVYSMRGVKQQFCLIVGR